MKLSEFGFSLPQELIASKPLEFKTETGKLVILRDQCRLLVLHRKTGEIEHKTFTNVVDYFDDKDMFVFNDTRVFPAKLYGNKEKTGAKIEVFLLRELNEEHKLWDVLVEPARKIRIGNKLYFGLDDSMVAEVIDNTTSRGRTLRFSTTDRTTNSSRTSLPWATPRCPTTSSASPSPRTKSATRPSLPATRVPSWLRPPVCTSRASS